MVLALLVPAWLVVMGLGDAAVILHSTTHNPASATLAIACGMLALDIVVTAAVALCWAWIIDWT